LLYLRCHETHIDVKHHSPQEFDSWRWVSYWYPLSYVIPFKRGVYQKALTELSPAMFQYIENGLKRFHRDEPPEQSKQGKGA
jgi:putative (di)nucleoside polyphosphate hydrolase